MTNTATSVVQRDLPQIGLTMTAQFEPASLLLERLELLNPYCHVKNRADFTALVAELHASSGCSFAEIEQRSTELGAGQRLPEWALRCWLESGDAWPSEPDFCTFLACLGLHYVQVHTWIVAFRVTTSRSSS